MTARVTSMAIAFILLAAMSAGAQGQHIEPKYKLTPRNPPNPASVHSAFSGTVDFISWWLNLWVETKIRHEVRAAIDSQINKQAEVLQWTGNGALVNLRIIRGPGTDSPLQQIGILGEGATVLGYGPSAKDALIDSYRSQAWQQGVPDGWTVDHVMSAYVWVYPSSRGKIERIAVERGTMIDLNKHVNENWPVLLRQRLERKLDNLNVWNRVAETAQRRIREHEARKAVADSLAAVTASQRRVADINSRLRLALEREKAAADATRLISALQGVLNVAELAAVAADHLGENPAVFNETNSGAAIVAKAEQIRDERRAYSVKMQAEFDGSYNDLKRFLDSLWVSIQPSAPPSVVKREFEIERPLP